MVTTGKIICLGRKMYADSILKKGEEKMRFISGSSNRLIIDFTSLVRVVLAIF